MLGNTHHNLENLNCDEYNSIAICKKYIQIC